MLFFATPSFRLPSHWVFRGVHQYKTAELWLDLLPDWTDDALSRALQQTPNHKSLSKRLKEKFHLSAVKLSLIQELHHQQPSLPVSTLLKALPIKLTSTRPIAEAISSAGGVKAQAFDKQLMLKRYPGVFCAGEMLDWDAPTGGYLLTACLATGKWAANGVDQWLRTR
jgi:hypothetical protein